MASHKDKVAMKGHGPPLWWRGTLMIFHSGSNRFKLVFGMFMMLAWLWLASRASFIMGWHYDSNVPNVPGASDLPRYRYTVLLNTWKRDDLLKQSVAHYSSCKSVDAIRVIWSEIEPPSENLLSVLSASIFSSSKTATHIPEFRIDLNDNDNLNNRFKSIKGLKTEAVFSIDDDVIVPCQTLELAFSVWLSAPDSMVGFVPRMHWTESERHGLMPPSYRYGGWWSVWWTGTYSMVLTKAVFFHQKYLDLYTHHLPPAIREYVRSERNCEDIAMSFLIANVTGAPPVWVKGRIYEIGSTGISSLSGHNHRRTHCLNYFSSLFGQMPLVASNVKVVPAYREWFW